MLFFLIFDVLLEPGSEEESDVAKDVLLEAFLV